MSARYRLLPVIFFVASAASAERLPTTVVPTHYELRFVVDLGRARFTGNEAIRVEVREPTAKVVLNAADIEFGEVTIDEAASAQKAAIALNGQAQTATLSVARPLPAGAHTIHVRFSGRLNDQLRGFYLSSSSKRKYAVTQFESTDARRAFPNFDEPAFKATFAVTVTANKGDVVISNGRVVSDVPADGGRQHTVTFSTTPKMSSYLVAMAVGDFQCSEGSADNIPIRVCATADKKNLTRVALESAEQILKFYDQYFDIKYPFGKLDILAVPDFAAGAMENTAAIFFRETDLLTDAATASVPTRRNIASILAHEMAHMWFGDLVTMQWWDDIWLNEGFATWMANRPLAAWKPEWNIPVREELETQTALNIDALASTRPIHQMLNTPEEIDEAFDAIAYQKGAAVLRMVESYVGAETFRKGVNAYLAAHAYGSVTSADFWNAIAAASGKPVDRIMPSFVNQPGMPLVEVATACTSGQTSVTLAQQRFYSDRTAAHKPPPASWEIPICFKTGPGASTCDVLAEPARTVRVSGPACPASVFANAGGQGYFRTAYSPEMVRAFALRVQQDLTAAERLSLVDDEWAMVRAGRHSAADYLALASGYGREPSPGVLGEVTGKLDFVDQYLSSGGTRSGFEAFVRSLFQPVLASVGLSGSASDTDEQRELRAVVLRVLGRTANDPAVVAEARKALDRSLAGGAALDPTLADAIVDIAASHGDDTLYRALVAASARAASPQEHDRYLYAAAEFRDPAILDRALARALSSDIRTQDTAYYLSRFFGNPEARARAWTFIKEHWSALQRKITIFGGDTAFTRALGAFCDAGTRDDISNFFAQHPLRGAARTLDQTIERINSCIDVRDKQTKAVSDWLAGR